MLHESAEVFEGRLAALGRADRLISTDVVSLASLLNQELAAVTSEDASRYSLDGPNVVLHPDCTYALSLLIHELAANAEEHGSLSAPGGRVDVTWRCDDSDLALTWAESGGPPARRPLSPGFGNLLLAYTAAKLNGTVDHQYKQSGVICDVRVSLGARWPRRRSAMRLGISGDRAVPVVPSYR